MKLESFDDEGFLSLFDGSSLAGWHPAPRVYGTVYPGGPHLLDIFDERGIARPVEPEKHPAVWRVEDGYIVGEKDADGTIIGLAPDDPATSVEPVTQEKRDRLSHAADVNEFLEVWRWDDWNEIRIRCVGALPVITTWVNGLKIAELNTATLDSPDYDPSAVLECLGNRGHIAFEVHDNDATFGEARWGTGAQCRWRNIRIKDLGETPAST